MFARVLLFLLSLAASDAFSATPPPSGVLDQAGLLSPRMRDAIAELLAVEERLVGEQIVVAILKETDRGEQSLDSRAQELFSAWSIGQRTHGNGVLLLLSEHEARLLASFALESVFPEAERNAIVNEVLYHELKHGTPDRAFALAVMEILKSLESPLVRNGKAQEVLTRTGGFTGSWELSEPGAWTAATAAGVALGLALLALAIGMLMSAEAHYTSEGWYRPRPWRKAALRRLFTKRSLADFPGGGTARSWAPPPKGQKKKGKKTEARASPIPHAITETEAVITGEIRVHLAQAWTESDPFGHAVSLFREFGMEKTTQRNAVLIYVNLRRHRLAIIGDLGIHESVGQGYWDELGLALSDDLGKQDPETALAVAVLTVGETMKKHFPAETGHS